MKNNLFVLIAGILLGISVMLFIGAKWDATSSKASAAACAITCSADGKYVYAAGLNSIYRSEDFGKSWTEALSEDDK